MEKPSTAPAQEEGEVCTGPSSHFRESGSKGEQLTDNKLTTGTVLVKCF
jgi:hypothetical protein